MYHHDQRDYKVAVDETAKKFKRELEDAIHQSQRSALTVIERVQNQLPEDRMVHTKAMTFSMQEENNVRQILMGIKGRGKNAFQMPLHRHALSQVADAAGVPDAYITKMLAKPYGPELILENFNTIFDKEDDQKRLVRAINGQVRGVLSDTYRRMDSRPIIEAFAGACQQAGLVPIEGVGGDLRFCVRAVLPLVFSPAGQEVIAFGCELSNSDFGCGALSLRVFILRIWCTNYARLEEEIRKVHLGKRLDDNLELSQATYDLDTKTMASATKDVVLASLAPAKVNGQVALLEKAMTEKIDFKQSLDTLPKMGLLKKEVDAVREIYNNGGVEELPPGNTLYRMSNAISWIAKSAETAERRLELEQVAGELLLPKKRAAA